MKFGIDEILRVANSTKGKEAKIEYLRKWDSKTLRNFLYCVYSPDVKFYLPKKEYKYRPWEGYDAYGALYYEFKKVPRYFTNESIPLEKREKIWIQFLESIDAGDAKLMEAARHKRIPYRYVNKKLVQEAFPDLLPEVSNAKEEPSKSA